HRARRQAPCGASSLRGRRSAALSSAASCCRASRRVCRLTCASGRGCVWLVSRFSLPRPWCRMERSVADSLDLSNLESWTDYDLIETLMDIDHGLTDGQIELIESYE